MTRAILILFAVVGLSGCGGGTPGDDQIVITSSGGGAFSGTAGLGWTEDEIRQTVCLPGTLTAFGIERTETHYNINGRCAEA